jgi:hypothetical protein
MSIDTYFSPSNYSHQQKECCLCLKAFELKQRVTQLVCLHLYHSNCDAEKTLMHCPKCRTPLKERLITQPSTKNDAILGPYGILLRQVRLEASNLQDSNEHDVSERIDTLSDKLVDQFLKDHQINRRYISLGRPDLLDSKMGFFYFNSSYMCEELFTLSALLHRLEINAKSSIFEKIMLKFYADERIKKIIHYHDKLQKEYRALCQDLAPQPCQISIRRPLIPQEQMLLEMKKKLMIGMVICLTLVVAYKIF